MPNSTGLLPTTSAYHWCTYVETHRITTTMETDYWMYSVLGRTHTGYPIAGSGLACQHVQARLAAWGEAAERYCLRLPRPDHLLEATVAELPADPIPVSVYQPFDDAQWQDASFPYEPFDPSRPDLWTLGKRLSDGTYRAIPASLVWLIDAPRVRLTAGVSTGAAAHRSRLEAIRRGLYEVIERDAFTIVWESRAVTPLLDPFESEDADLVRLARIVADGGRRLLLRDITTDLGIPVVLAVIVDEGGERPALALGAAARWTYRDAMRKAAFEAYHTWVWMSEEHLRDHGTSWQSAWNAACRPRLMMAHPFLYGFPELLPLAVHLWRDGPRRSPIPPSMPSPGSTEDEVRRLVERLTQRGFHPLVVDITLDDVACMGLTVQKVLVPGLVPLSIGAFCRPLAHPRLRDVPTVVGWQAEGVYPHGQGVPHPFP